VALHDDLARARAYDLAQPLEASIPTIPHHVPFRMALTRRHGDVVRPDGTSAATELISLSGHTGTHIDALCHFSAGGALHGGIDAREACMGGRFASLGVDTIAPIACRGVLLDVPGALGAEALEPGRPITAADLEATARHHGVEVRDGDAVLVRTGWPVGRLSDPTAFLGEETGVPGPDASSAGWLAERGVRVTGSDTLAYEWLEPGAGLSRLPVHEVLLVRAGIPIIEVMQLEALAGDDVHEFAFVAAPLRLVGATGSPLRPLALA
jgi:kynurenine formamidase